MLIALGAKHIAIICAKAWIMVQPHISRMNIARGISVTAQAINNFYFTPRPSWRIIINRRWMSQWINEENES